MIDILHHEKIEDGRLPEGAISAIHVFCVQVTDIKAYAESLVKEITDTSWIDADEYLNAIANTKSAYDQ